MRGLAFFIVAPVVGCSSEPDIGSQLGEEGLASVAVADEESITIHLRGPDYKVSESGEVYRSENVEAVIGPNDQIWSQKVEYRVNFAEPFDGEDVTQILEQKNLSREQYQDLRDRLSSYRPLRLAAADEELTDSEYLLTPRGCPTPVGLRTPVFVRFKDGENASGTFLLPASCDSPSGRLVKQDLKDILASLPELEGFSPRWIR